MAKFANLNDHEIDTYIYQNLLKAPTKELADDFLSAAKRLCDIRGNTAGWNHSVCHFIEKYGQTDREFPSLLTFLGLPNANEFPQYREALAMLVEKAWPDTNCLDRIMGPIFDFNLFEARKHPENPEFAFFSPAFRDPKNLKVAEEFFVKDNYNDNRRVCLMMTSDGPAEVWKKALAGGIPLSSAYSASIYADFPASDAELAAYLDAAFGGALRYAAGGLTASEVVSNIRADIKKEILPGIFVDVDGTLLMTRDGADSLNTELHEMLVKALDKEEPARLANGGWDINCPITVFSGGDPVVQTKRLQAVGCDMRLLPVQSKTGFRGITMQTLIDDTQPRLSGFGAETWIWPSDRAKLASVLCAAEEQTAVH